MVPVYIVVPFACAVTIHQVVLMWLIKIYIVHIRWRAQRKSLEWPFPRGSGVFDDFKITGLRHRLELLGTVFHQSGSRRLNNGNVLELSITFFTLEN